MLKVLLIVTALTFVGCDGQLTMGLGLAEGAAGALSKVALTQLSDDKLAKVEEISGEGAEIAGKIEAILSEVHEAAVDEQNDRLERELDG